MQLSPASEWALQVDGWNRELIAAGLTPVPRHQAHAHLFGKSPNFMTQDLIGYYYVDGDPVEISTGMFLELRLFGVTFPRIDTSTPDPRDFVVESIDEVVATLTRKDPA